MSSRRSSPRGLKESAREVLRRSRLHGRWGGWRVALQPGSVGRRCAGSCASSAGAPGVQAARRSYRWWRPPTSGIATMSPSPAHDWTRNRRVLVQRQVSPGPFVVANLERHQLPHARFVEHDHVIETLAPSGSNNRSTNAFCQGACGAVSTSSMPIAFAPGAQGVECMIAIVDQIARRLVPRKCLSQLLGRPYCRRMRRDRDVPDASAIVQGAPRRTRGGRLTVGTTKKSAATIWPM